MIDKLDELLKCWGISTSFARELFTQKAAIHEWQKNTAVFTEGKRNTKEYLLLTGVAHRYTYSEKEECVTTGFYLPGSIITPHFARTKDGKSIFHLQALTDVVLAEIQVDDLDRLRTTNEEFQAFGQRVVERELSKALQQEVAFRSSSAKERLLALREQYPNLENLISHTIIASYLGITNVSFSRLRNEMARK